MKRQLLTFGIGLGLIAGVSPAYAVQPAPVTANENVEWSKVVTNPFDGKIVYDRNYKDDFVFVSSWSKDGIRATYTELRRAFAGYQTTWHTDPFFYRHGRRTLGYYPDEVPVYLRYGIDSVPEAIEFAINGQRFTYETGPVSSELATALANASPTNMTIRLVWKDGRTKDIEIGKGTVEAWKAIFKT